MSDLDEMSKKVVDLFEPNIQQVCEMCKEPLEGRSHQRCLGDRWVQVCPGCWMTEVNYDDYMVERFENGG